MIRTVFACALLAAVVAYASPTKRDKPKVGGVCVYNDAWFVMRYRIHNLRSGYASDWSSEFSAYKNRCMIPGSMEAAAVDLRSGDESIIESQVEWGKDINSSIVFVYDDNTADVTDFKCTGTTLRYACNLGTGQSLQNATAAVGEFITGFAEGLAEQLGFDKCISDLESTYTDVADIAKYLKSGINLKESATILQSFELAGKVLEAFASAIKDCVSAAKSLASKIKDVADILTANVADLIKTVITDAIHIYNDRTDITADAKAVTAAWDGGDYETSGEGMGKIVGILIEDIGRRR